MSSRVIVALGGNALWADGQRGTWGQQLANATKAARGVVELQRAGYRVVLTHGNGPQVGALSLQQSAGEAEVPPMPFDVLVAMTQGHSGFLLATAISAIDPTLATATVMTRVRVRGDDPAFESPAKPIGIFYDEATARRFATERGWAIGPDAGRGWRRLVPSPQPIDIVELEQIRLLSDSGALVIAVGGGGVPVIKGPGGLRGCDAVIDKDRASAELARLLDADLLMLVTGVPRVALDFGTRWQRDMSRLTVTDATRHLKEGEFPAGSMGPKIESAARFVLAGGRAAIVTQIDRMAEAVAGRDGTWIVPDSEGPSIVAPSIESTVAA